MRKSRKIREQWVTEKDANNQKYYFNREREVYGKPANYATFNLKNKLLFVQFGAGVNYYPSSKQTKMKREIYQLLQPLRTIFEFSIGNISKGKQNYLVNYYAILDKMPSNEQMMQMENILLQPVENEEYNGMTLQAIKKEIAQQQRYEFKKKLAEDERWEKHLQEYCS